MAAWAMANLLDQVLGGTDGRPAMAEVRNLAAKGHLCYFRAEEDVPSPLPPRFRNYPLRRRDGQRYFLVSLAQFEAQGDYVETFYFNGYLMTRHVLPPHHFAEI
jgi:hypothetical protein